MNANRFARDWRRVAVVGTLVGALLLPRVTHAGQQAYEPPVIEFAPEGISVDEAVRLGLMYDPLIKLEIAAREFQAGAVQEQTGVFDLTLAGNGFFDHEQADVPTSQNPFSTELDYLQSFTGAGLTGSGESAVNQVSSSLALDTEVGKLFRTGVSVTPFFSSSSDSSSFSDGTGVALGEGVGGDLRTLETGLSAVLPLGRGRGRDATAGAERAAQFDYAASDHAQRYQVAVTALSVVLAYWDLRSAQETREVAAASVVLQEMLVAATEQLIAGGQLAASDLFRTQSSEARARARLEQTALGLYDARTQLAKVMGLAVSEREVTWPLARDGFPARPDLQLLNADAVIVLADMALERREDLLAAVASQESGFILARQAETNLRPQLDVTAGAHSTALVEQGVPQPSGGWAGPSVSVGLEYARPFRNNFFKGQLVQREAEARQREISQLDLRRRVQLAVIQAARSVQQAVRRVEQASAAADFYRETLDAEVERLRAGEATLVDTILTEQQLTDSRFTLVAARAELASLIAELRFETGALVDYTNEGSLVVEPSLVTVPRVSRSQP